MSAARASDMLIAIWSFCEPEDREAFVTYLAISGYVNQSPSAVPAAVAVAKPQAPHLATAPIHPGPLTPGVATADPAHQVPKLSGAKSDVPHIVGQGCAKQVNHYGHSGQEPADEPQDGNEAVSGEAASVTNFDNPRCQHPDTCAFANSRDCCHDCLMSWAQRPKDEQIRLWAEANEAAGAA